ncbi:sugar ABC transporter substrate-binding protein [Streptomyces sp. NPDC051976]|uniref:sugar ABC transporter substrate-binding protein n=1 Tax=Streptomyces sp. NPDC051976 TaxID=3154947 RepID=UPI0034424318
MRTTKLALAASLTTILALSACSSTDSKSSTSSSGGGARKLTIGVSFDQLNAIRQAELNGIKKAAAQQGDKVEFAAADNDAAKQSSQIQDLLDTKKVDAVIVIAVNADQIQSSINRARASKVPFIAIDRAPTDSSNVAFQITGDPVADGKLAAQQLIAQNKPLKVLELVGGLTDKNAIGRRDGFNDALKGNANVQVAAQVPTDWDPSKALDGVSNALQKNPGINAIYVPSDFLWPSVESALKSASRLAPAPDPKHVTVVTIDGDPNGCAAIRNKRIDADIATLIDSFGLQSVDAAHTLAQGKSLAQKTVGIAGLPLNQTNAATTTAKVWGCAVPAGS